MKKNMSSYQSIWWREYRKNKYKPRKTLSKEMAFRESIVLSFKEYVKTCSLAGVSQMANASVGIKEGVFWLIMFCTVMGTLCYCLSYVWSGLSKPLIVTMESSTYPISKIEFPAVALCNINRISRKATQEVADEIMTMVKEIGINKNTPKEFYPWVVREAGRFLNFAYSESFVKNISDFDFSTITDTDSRILIGLMEKLAPKCSDMLIRCAWEGKQFPCDELFTMRRTVRGHCCTFNYVLLYNESDRFNTTIPEVKRQHIHGILHGLNVIMDPMIDDYSYSLLPIKGFEVLLFDPRHYPDFSIGRVVHRIVEINMINQLELQSRTKVATAEVRKYSIDTRKCLFSDENVANFGHMYSLSSCIINCRTEAFQSLCRCTPYFLPTKERSPICSMEDLRCLSKYKEKLLFLYPIDPITKTGLEQEYLDSLWCPQCLPDCEHTQHFTRSNRLPLTYRTEHSNKFFTTDFIHGINMTNKCILSVYQSTRDGTLDKLDVVYYWFELLSNVGGFGGILLGFSLIGGVEFIYFFLVRFFIVLIEKLK